MKCASAAFEKLRNRYIVSKYSNFFKSMKNTPFFTKKVSKIIHLVNKNIVHSTRDCRMLDVKVSRTIFL